MSRRVSILEMRVANLLNHPRFPIPVREFRFHPTRLWRFDFCWPDLRIALEIEGGVFSRGAHSRGAGYTKDTEKYNQATIMGYRILRYTVKNLNDIPRDLDAMLNKIERKI